MGQVSLVGKEILGYKVTELLGSGTYGTVYKVVKQNASGSYVRALKHITIPSEKQYESVLNSMGGDYAKANNYFDASLEGIVREIKILNELSENGATHIVKYYENQIDVQDNPRCYNVYILMEYLTPLEDHIKSGKFNVKDVVNLGLDILEGLMACHRSDVIHRDIKDDNIFYSEKGGYKIGDFGVSKVLKGSERAESVKGTPNYIAPEIILNKGSYNKSVDLYSLGIVLYRLLNSNRNPFLPHYPAQYTSQDEEDAYAKRMTGAVPDIPSFGGEAIGKVVVKAIMSADERYQDAKKFYDELETALHNTAPDILEQSVKGVEESPIGNQAENPNNKTGEYGETLSETIASGTVNDFKITPGNKETNNPGNANSNLFKTIGEEKKEPQIIGRVIDLDKKVEEEIKKPPFYEKFLTKEWGIKAAVAIVALIGISCFVFTGRPKPVVENYINAIATADFGKAYQCFEIKKYPTLGTPAYLKFVEFARNSKEDNIYKLAQNEIKSVDLVEGVENNGIIPFDANIVVKKNNTDEIHKLTIFVEKTKNGPLGLFTAYKIAGNGVYAIPKINCLTGTEQVAIDNVNLAGEKEKLNLKQPVFYGWHDVECRGKFYDSFKDRANFDKESGMLKLDGKKFKLNSACNEALNNASKEFATLFFPATLTDNGYKQCKTLPNEKTVDEMYKNFSEGFKQVGVSSIKITDGKLLSSFAGENGNIQCQYQYVGTYEQNGQPEKVCDGVINLEYISDNGQLIVAKVNDYTIHLKD